MKANPALAMLMAVAVWLLIPPDPVGKAAEPPRMAFKGPLRVHPTNPRYFTDDGKRAIYLTGSHTWQNLQDGGPTDPPASFDFQAYLDFLITNHHNFFRLWAWESDRESAWDRQRLWVRPLPYLRTGPGRCPDGQLRFDVTRFDSEYFLRLKDRVRAAQERGIYVGVMLFQGFSVAKKSPRAQGNPWLGHPFHRDNNINGIDGDANGDGNGYEVHTLDLPRITALQEAYVRKVVETVGEFDNVIYEISNESHGGSTAWQFHLINLVKTLESRRRKQHPAWMSFQMDQTSGPGDNRTLFISNAQAISPHQGMNGVDDYMTNPPVADGSKVIMLDTDHLWGIGGDAVWVWKAFTRGMNPVFMDPYQRGSPPGKPRLEARWQGIRRAMGQTRQFAEKLNLAGMTPVDDTAFCSTCFCLREPGREYLVFQPAAKTRFMLDLRDAPGAFKTEWINISDGAIIGSPVISGSAIKSFLAPFDGPATLHLKRQ